MPKTTQRLSTSKSAIADTVEWLAFHEEVVRAAKAHLARQLRGRPRPGKCGKRGVFEGKPARCRLAAGHDSWCSPFAHGFIVNPDGSIGGSRGRPGFDRERPRDSLP